MVKKMPSLHMSEDELARDVHAALAKVRQGVEIIIERDHHAIAVISPFQAASGKGRKLSECVALAQAYEERHGSAALPDADFARDVQAAIDAHRDPFEPPAWD